MKKLSNDFLYLTRLEVEEVLSAGSGTVDQPTNKPTFDFNEMRFNNLQHAVKRVSELAEQSEAPACQFNHET